MIALGLGLALTAGASCWEKFTDSCPSTVDGGAKGTCTIWSGTIVKTRPASVGQATSLDDRTVTGPIGVCIYTCSVYGTVEAGQDQALKGNACIATGGSGSGGG
jgi:hypothetical protein